MKKFIITESEKKEIRTLYGILSEQEIKKCKKCIGNYTGELDKCGFYAVERFEENYGTATGESMGDDYFEGTYSVKDKLISERLNKYIPKAWSSMTKKTKMQIWSFMFNSDSESGNDHFRWLAVLYLTANNSISEFDEQLTMEIINNKDSQKWNEAIKLVNSTTNWDYTKLLKMIDGQYKTYNPVKYLKTWSYRPKYLDLMYDDCTNGIDPFSNEPDTIDSDSKIVIKGDKSLSVEKDGTYTDDGEKDFKDKIRTQTENKSIDLDSINFDGNNLILQYKEGDTNILRMSFIWDNISDDNLKDRIDTVKTKNSEYDIKVFGEDEGKNPRGFWWRGLVFVKK